MRGAFVVALLVAALGPAGATARPAPAPALAPIPLIPLQESQGGTVLDRSRARADFLPLVEQFVTQANLAYCGVASAVMALNSLAVPAPPAQGYGTYRFWTQDNLFSTAAAQATVAPETVARRGMTLVQRWHGDQLSLPQLRGLLRQSLADPSDRLLVNYHRSALGQQGGGHISPLAAYDERGDRVLLLDVARYRYPSVWVPIPALWQAIRMVDPDSGLSRGLVRLRWSGAAPPPPEATPRSAP